MIPVCEDSKVSEKLFEYFRSGVSLSESEGVDDEAKNILEAVHYNLWSAAEEEHKKKSAEFIDRRIQSLKRSYDARESRILVFIDSATDENIIRMRNDELKNVKEERQKEVKKLEAAKERAELEARPVGYGIVEVRR